MPTVRDESVRLKLIDRVKKLTGRETSIWGKMNVSQMMSHLVQAGELPFTESLPDKSSFAARKLIKPLILYVLPIPKGAKVSADFDQQINGRKPTEFESDRDLVIEFIDRLGTLPVDFECKYHPMFGKMNAKEWALLVHKHVDHHLKQFGV